MYKSVGEGTKEEKEWKEVWWGFKKLEKSWSGKKLHENKLNEGSIKISFKKYSFLLASK